MTVEEMDTLITRRLLAFHDALVERGQIPPIKRIAPPAPGGEEVSVEVVNHYKGEHAACVEK